MRDGGSFTVEMKARFIVCESARLYIDPRISVSQHAGLPAGKAAVCEMKPGVGGDADAGAAAHEVNIIDICDVGIGGSHADSIGKDCP